MRDIYGVHSNTQKAKVYTAYSHFFKVPSIVTTIEKKAHAVRRSISVRALTPAAVKGLEGLILKNCNIFFKLLEEDTSSGQAELVNDNAWGEGKNMTRLVSWLMSDIMVT
jgi:cytochrome P450